MNILTNKFGSFLGRCSYHCYMKITPRQILHACRMEWFINICKYIPAQPPANQSHAKTINAVVSYSNWDGRLPLYYSANPHWWPVHWQLTKHTRRSSSIVIDQALRQTSGNTRWWRHHVPDSKVHGANMGPIWGRQDPGGPHVGPMNFAVWNTLKYIASLML